MRDFSSFLSGDPLKRNDAMQHSLDQVYDTVRGLPVYGDKRDRMIRAATQYIFDVFDTAAYAQLCELHGEDSYSELSHHASCAMAAGFEAFPRARQDIAKAIDRLAIAYHASQPEPASRMAADGRGLVIMMPMGYSVPNSLA